jgi:putative FmdB family regulatory protein
MPIYEYQCESCGHRQDALQKISDPPLSECGACGQPGLRKLMSAPRFRLKGSGWYETDFKTDNRRNLADGGDGGGEGKAAGEGKGAGAEGSKTSEEKSGAKKADGEGKSAAGKTPGDSSKPAASNGKSSAAAGPGQ